MNRTINAVIIQPEIVSIVIGVTDGLAIKIIKVNIVPNDNPMPKLESKTTAD